MPGIVGFMGNSSQEEVNVLIASMAFALHPEQRFRKEFFSVEGIGLGRVGLGIRK
jgi:hypothetical protein